MANDGLQSYEIDSGLNIYRHFYRKDVLKGDKRKRDFFDSISDFFVILK